MSMSSKSLFLLKTRDLSVQDHSMNIEVMLAPNRTYLLMNKHKTLTAKSNKQKDDVERQRDSSTHSYVSEKRLVDRRNQEFYIKRVNMFLNQLQPSVRTTVLDRKSFSPSLNKIQYENKQASEAVQTAKNKPRVKSEPPTPRGSINSSFPLIPTDRRQSKSSVGFHERANDKDNVTKQTDTYGRSRVSVKGNSLTIQGSRFQNETRSNVEGCISPTSGYFPPVSPTHNITRDAITPVNQIPSPQPVTMDRKRTSSLLPERKKVKFVPPKDQNGYKKWEETQMKEKRKVKYLDKKIERFMLDQIRFNQANRISHYDPQRRAASTTEDSKYSNKGNLIEMFDAFCQTGGKQQMHKLVKMAARMKVKKNTSTTSTSLAPSVASFKNSQTFKHLNQVLVR
ncbi:uncharacterized protein LOC132546019 [Ylistrum balloti]|uniref:uncharacterized protein LOC132546019 n=1 Tax=Ylistrum balloti TaxID=509963 RepID=UPI0029059134|nr:uncharacterized protein LOC132546019 [Ylistrum balloti]